MLISIFTPFATKGGGALAVFFRLDAACPDRGVMGGRREVAFFDKENGNSFFYLLKVLGPTAAEP